MSTTYDLSTTEGRGALALKVSQSRYVGAGYYASPRTSFSSLDFFRLLRLFCEHATPDMHPNSLGLIDRSSLTHPPRIDRMRRGKRWDKTLDSIGDMNCTHAAATRCPSSAFKAVDFNFLDRQASGIRVAMASSIWGATLLPEFNVLPDGGLNLFFDAFALERVQMKASFGFINLYPKSCYRGVMPCGLGRIQAEATLTPLVCINVAERSDGAMASRLWVPVADGRLDHRPMEPYDDRPYNLYWGNIVDRKLAGKVGLEGFLLEVVGLRAVGGRDELSSGPSLWTMDDEFIFFSLSGDLADSLTPSEEYSARYLRILDFYRQNDFLFTG